MIRKVLYILFFSTVVLAASQYKLDLKDDYVRLILPAKLNNFLSDSSTGKVYSVVLKGKYEINEDIWGYSVTKISSSFDGNNTKIDFYFDDSVIKPDIKYENNQLLITFKTNIPSSKNSNVYMRMFLGILVILVLILILYWFLKLIMKKNISTEIPGMGRLLGKVDIMPGRSIAFYEVVTTIYVIGITSENISLLDKIEDEIICDKIREGFTRKKNFSSYMKFFDKGIDSTEIDITQEIIKEKVDRLKRK